ncbi:hypothetical protein [Ancylobacter polymorphus]|uniref:Tat pathway signal protein n=1 Tax=Ancylobacter polymorphus TaxID=223390 RepID=A0A9E7A4Y5_9HYPH|nr:hypothetical protein [Ancylobacter polymorphus]UOK73240.1 hypothetical protein K9D25_18945 [Ancylobacter polymorphus]
MLSRRSLLKVAAALLSAPLGIAAHQTAQAQSAPTSPPPAPRREPRPAPRRGYAWVPGHWAWWPGRGWVWSAGHWEENRRGFEYVGPRWVLRRGQWVYEPGRWVRSWR